MDGEEERSHMREDMVSEPNGPMESKKREAKGTCLKIEGQDGYVFKSYSINPRETAEETSPAISSLTLDRDSPPSPPSLPLSPQDDKESETDPTSSPPSNKCLNTETEGNAENESYENGTEGTLHIKEEPRDANGLDEEEEEEEEETPDDDGLGFGSSVGPFVTRDGDDYSNLLSGYTSTLYDVAMDAVTQSLLSSMRSNVNPRKKSPAWNHFCISPRDSTKAICLYCMKEFSRGKNEKDLSTSCLMRHVRRAHPTVLLQDGADVSSLTASLSSPLMPPSPSSPKNGDLTNGVPPSASPSTSSAETADPPSKEVFPKVEPNPEAYGACGAPSSSHPDDAGRLEEPSDGGGPERLLGTPRSSSSRRRSAVWKHFYLSPADNSKAVCVHCMNEFSRGKNGKDLGTSCLIRHMWRAHKEVVIEENGQGNHIPPPYTNPPSLLSRAQLREPLEVKKEFPLLPPSPDAISDGLPRSTEESMGIKEERDEAMNLSGQDSSLRRSFKTPGDDDDTRPAAFSEGSSLNQDHLVFQQNKKIMKRVKSEVWHHFIVSPVDQLKALCRYCPCVISRGKRGDFGTSCLMRHLMRRHPDVLKNQKGLDEKDSSSSSPPPHPYPNLAATDAVSTKETESSVAQRKPRPLPAFSKKTSKLWNHFSISPTDPTKVVCLHCGRTISRGKKTTNLGTSCLFRHMQRFHGHVLESSNAVSGGAPQAAGIRVKQELADTPVFPAEQSGERFDEHHPVAKRITELLAEMLALDLQPSAVVENAGLRRLLEFLQPQYSLPPASHFTSAAIPEMYARVKDAVLTHLKEAESGVVHFTASIWVSSQTREYLTLTAHWAAYESSVRPRARDFHCSALLSASPIDCDRDARGVPEQLERLWDAWIAPSGLRRGFTVADGAALRGALEERGHAALPCFGRTVDLIVGDAIKSQRLVQNLLSIARKLCERVHRSPRATGELAALQRLHRLPERPLLQDVPSKWATSFSMLERLVEQRAAVDAMSAECNFREAIGGDQWEVLLSVCAALKPFAVACREMSERTATLGQVIPLVHILNRKVDLLFDETVGIDNMLVSLKEAMLSRLSATLRDPRYAWATMLDPRYKTSLFTEEEAERCKQELIGELDAAASSTSAAAKPALHNGCGEGPVAPGAGRPNKDNLWSLMADIRQKIKHEEKPKSSELAVLEYLEEDILDQSCDPLDYWNLKKFLWPDLAKVAARYVGCPPSVVPAETLFSTAGVSWALNQHRPSLENVEALLFLKVNLPLIYFQY